MGERVGFEVVILVGLQASGKSSFRRAHFEPSHVVVSKDDFRNNRRPARRQEQLLRQALAARRSVVVDNTNPRLEDRRALIELGREYGASVVGYFLRSSLDDALQRNAARTGVARVPEVGLLSVAKWLVPPTWSEGFDELYEVRLAPPAGFLVSPMTKDAQ